MIKKNKTPRTFSYEILIQSIAIIITAVFLGILAIGVFQYYTSKKIIKNMTVPNPVFPVQFTIFGASKDTISGKFTFLTLDQKEVAQIERSWNGSELFLDFCYVQFDDKILYFPYRLYTEETNPENPHAGTIVTKYYQSRTRNKMYTYKDQPKKERTDFMRLFHFAHTMSIIPILNENAGLKTVKLSSFTAGKVHTVKITGKDIVIIPEQVYFQ